jgi:hypothetical protein
MLLPWPELRPASKPVSVGRSDCPREGRWRPLWRQGSQRGKMISSSQLVKAGWEIPRLIIAHPRMARFSHLFHPAAKRAEAQRSEMPDLMRMQPEFAHCVVRQGACDVIVHHASCRHLRAYGFNCALRRILDHNVKHPHRTAMRHDVGRHANDICLSHLGATMSRNNAGLKVW